MYSFTMSGVIYIEIFLDWVKRISDIVFIINSFVSISYIIYCFFENVKISLSRRLI